MRSILLLVLLLACHILCWRNVLSTPTTKSKIDNATYQSANLAREAIPEGEPQDPDFVAKPFKEDDNRDNGEDNNKSEDGNALKEMEPPTALGSLNKTMKNVTAHQISQKDAVASLESKKKGKQMGGTKLKSRTRRKKKSRKKLRHSRAASRSLRSSPDTKDGDVNETKAEGVPKSATVKLVKWLRNRLQKRLAEVAELESKTKAEEILVRSLSTSISNASVVRENEIKLKIESQKKLSDFRMHTHVPDQEMEDAKVEAIQLANQLEHLRRTYDSMASLRKDLRDKIRSAGFSHWLDARGKEYLPETAVGVLSKSAEILSPVSQGLEKAIELDRMLSSEVEKIVPAPEESILSLMVRDIAMLSPLIPLLFAACRFHIFMNTVSKLHVALYIPALFVAESLFVIALSSYVGKEALRVCQAENEVVFVTCIFLNAFLLAVFAYVQTFLALLLKSRSEVIQTILTYSIAYHFFRNTFEPAVVSRPVATSVIGHLLYVINFAIILFEKKRYMRIHVPYEDQINKVLQEVRMWTKETVEAMKRVFSEKPKQVDNSHVSQDERMTLTMSDTSLENSFRAEVKHRRPLSQLSDTDEMQMFGTQESRGGHRRWNRRRSPVTDAFQRHYASHGNNWPINIVASGSRRRNSGGPQPSTMEPEGFYSCRE